MTSLEKAMYIVKHGNCASIDCYRGNACPAYDPMIEIGCGKKSGYGRLSYGVGGCRKKVIRICQEYIAEHGHNFESSK